MARYGVAAVLTTLICASAIKAQPESQTSVESGWTYEIGPHVWFTGVRGKIRLGDDETEFDFGHDYFSNSANPFEVGVTARFRAWRAAKSFMLDLHYLEEKRGFDPSPGNIVKIQFKQFLADLSLGFSLRVDQPRVDVIGGLRTVILQPDVLYDNSVSTTKGRIWANLFLGAVIRTRLTANLEPVVRGDVGGLRSDSKTWSIWAGLDYRVSSVVTLRGGYRRIDLDHTDDGESDIFRYDVTTDGVVLGFSVTL
jgi:opacity protein-like surface antigen